VSIGSIVIEIELHRRKIWRMMMKDERLNHLFQCQAVKLHGRLSGLLQSTTSTI